MSSHKDHNKDENIELSQNEKELLEFLLKMMETPDDKGKEWWEEYDREFEKHRLKLKQPECFDSWNP